MVLIFSAEMAQETSQFDERQYDARMNESVLSLSLSLSILLQNCIVIENWPDLGLLKRERIFSHLTTRFMRALTPWACRRTFFEESMHMVSISLLTSSLWVSLSTHFSFFPKALNQGIDARCLSMTRCLFFLLLIFPRFRLLTPPLPLIHHSSSSSLSSAST